MMDIITGLDVWFADRLQGLQRRPETTAYIVGVLKARGNWSPEDDLSDRSIILTFAAAVQSGDFAQFQRLGDWILWADVVVPEHFADSRELVDGIGRRAYYSCHRILRGQWRVYEELADELPTIVQQVRSKLATVAPAR